MAWMTLTQAAVATGVSVRTLYRRIEAEGLETRRDGRLTLVNIDTNENGDSDPARQSMATTGGTPQPDGESFWAREAFETLQNNVRRARRSAVMAWGTSVLMLGATIGAGWLLYQSQLKYESQLDDVRATHQRALNQVSLTQKQALSDLAVSYEQAHRELERDYLTRIDGLNDHIARRDGETTVLSAELDKSQDAYGSLQNVVTETRGQLESTAAELAMVTSQRDRLTQAYAALQDAADSNESRVHQLEGELTQLAQQRESLSTRLTSVQQDLNTKIDKLGQTTGALTTIEKTAAQLREELATARSDVADARSTSGELTGQLTAGEQARADLTGTIDELRDLLERERDARASIHEQLEVAMTHLSHVTADRDRLSDTLQQVQAAEAEEPRIIEASHEPAGPIDSSASPEVIEPVEAPEPSVSPDPSGVESVPTTQPASDEALPAPEVLNRTAMLMD